MEIHQSLIRSCSVIRPTTKIDTRQIIIELLSQLGSSREAREYLKRFNSVDSVQFAVIKIGGQVIRDQISELASALHFLYQAGLYPIVLHGAGPQIDLAINEAGIDSGKIDGLRVTTPQIMSIVRRVIYDENLKLVNALENIGAKARTIQHGVFECQANDNPELGLVGKVARVHLDSIRSAIEASAIPVVTCLGESAGGQVMNLNADHAVNALIREIRPYKIIFITATGGLLNENGQIISSINLVTDYPRLQEVHWIHSGMRVKLNQIREMLECLPDAASVSITSAANLTKELFTHNGAGTLIRKGERISTVTEPTADERTHLTDLIEECFQRQLDPNWFASLDQPQVLWVESRRAAAVTCIGEGSIRYLDKFAVTPDAQGEGLGGALWKEVAQTHRQLYWRSRSNNQVNPWYQRQADFSRRVEPWIIFGYGISDFDLIGKCIVDAVRRPRLWLDES